MFTRNLRRMERKTWLRFAWHNKSAYIVMCTCCSYWFPHFWMFLSCKSEIFCFAQTNKTIHFHFNELISDKFIYFYLIIHIVHSFLAYIYIFFFILFSCTAFLHIHLKSSILILMTFFPINLKHFKYFIYYQIFAPF